MVELQALGPMGCGQGEGRIVPSQVCEPGTSLPDRVDEPGHAGVWRRPREERCREAGLRVIRHSRADAFEHEEHGLAAGRQRLGLREQPVERRVLERQGQLGGPERRPGRDGDDDGRDELAVRARQDGSRGVVVRPGPHGPLDTDHVVGRVRRQDQSPGRVGARPDPLGEPLYVVGDQPDRTIHHRSRASSWSTRRTSARRQP